MKGEVLLKVVFQHMCYLSALSRSCFGEKSNRNKVCVAQPLQNVFLRTASTSLLFQICFSMLTPIPGEMIQFDVHFFQSGWFNHQLAIVFGFYLSRSPLFTTIWGICFGTFSKHRISKSKKRFLRTSPSVVSTATLLK